MSTPLFQFYKSTIITHQNHLNKLDYLISILQKYDYNVVSIIQILLMRIISILQKYDYNTSVDCRHNRELKFQFYKSTIITQINQIFITQTFISILQKYDYNKGKRFFLFHQIIISILQKYDYNWMKRRVS